MAIDNRVIIEVSGGVAECVHKPANVEVHIVDWDNLEESGIKWFDTNDPEAFRLWEEDQEGSFSELYAYLASTMDDEDRALYLI